MKRSVHVMTDEGVVYIRYINIDRDDPANTKEVKFKSYPANKSDWLKEIVEWIRSGDLLT